MDTEYLDLDAYPEYDAGSFRTFLPGERHVTRVFGEDVLLLVLAGILRFHEDGVPVEVHPGRYYVQRAGLYQQGLTVSDEPHYYYLHFRGTYCDRAGQLPLAGAFSPSLLEPLIQEQDRLERDPEAHPFQKTAGFYAILSALYGGGIAPEAGDSLAERVERYLQDHYTQPVSLDAVAAQFAYSKDHLIRAFRRRYRVTPYVYLSRLRMRLARQLLLSTGRPVAQVAAGCGYADLSAFHRAFLRETGRAPGQWRREAGGVNAGEDVGDRDSKAAAR